MWGKTCPLKVWVWWRYRFGLRHAPLRFGFGGDVDVGFGGDVDVGFGFGGDVDVG